MAFFRSQQSKQKNRAPARIRKGTIVYAVGDIHGRLDLLKDIEDKIEKDAITQAHAHKVIVYLGDYIDRGLHSKEVIEHLTNNPLAGFESIYLKGNHEIAMQLFLDSPKETGSWLLWGGDATLQSYNVSLRDEKGKKNDLEQLADALKKAIPKNHQDFYNQLTPYYEIDDYIFVHAGLKPGIAIEDQDEYDLTTIREDFIFSKQSFDKTIVFGHTVFSEPFKTQDRIGIDTGAYASGILTAVKLKNDSVTFISTGD